MADPRAVACHDDNHARYETYKADNSTIAYSATTNGGSSAVGLAVTLTSTDDTVALAGDGEVVMGKLISVESDLFCVVQIGGFCKLPGGASATLTVGTKIVGDLDGSSNKGYIQTLSETVSASPTQGEVQNVLKAAKTRGIIQNNDTTTAVVVDLG